MSPVRSGHVNAKAPPLIFFRSHPVADRMVQMRAQTTEAVPAPVYNIETSAGVTTSIHAVISGESPTVRPGVYTTRSDRCGTPDASNHSWYHTE